MRQLWCVVGALGPTAPVPDRGGHASSSPMRLRRGPDIPMRSPSVQVQAVPSRRFWGVPVAPESPGVPRKGEP